MTHPGKLWTAFVWGLYTGELWGDPGNLACLVFGVDPFSVSAEAHLEDLGEPFVDGDVEISKTFICVMKRSIFR